MNLNQTTAYIGVNATDRGGVSSLVKEIPKDERYNYYVVFMLFDLDKKEIRFDKPEPYESESVYEYNYFGNNPGASTQYYLSRDMNSLKYLLGTVLSDLSLLLQKHRMEKLELYNLIQKMSLVEMVEISDKQGGGKVNLNKLSYVKKHGFTSASLTTDKKAVEVYDAEGAQEKINFEKIIRDNLNDTAKKNKYPIIVPSLIKDGKNIILSNHPDYLEVVKREALEGQPAKTTKGKQQTKICYICGKEKNDVSYEFTKKFSKSRINKIYTTTTINTAPSFIKNNYDQVYSICQDCYNNLLTGEKEVREKYHGQLAGENVFIIPEAIEENFDYSNLQKIKNRVDWAFKSNDANTWISELANEVELMEGLFYTVNFVIYRTDGKSMSILQVIEDVPVLRFTKVVEAIAKNKARIEEHLKFMSLSSIYRIIPVRSNKKKEQIDIGRLLTLYKTLLAGGTLRLEILYSYAVEALDKGLKQLAKSDFDNYYNMDLFRYLGGKEDFFIKRIIMTYLVLIGTGQQLGVFKDDFRVVFKGGGDSLKMPHAPGIEKSISKMEEFLDGQDFGKESRALFYLGAVINRVAVAQLKKEHKTKPILKKISYQGMNNREVYRLYNDVIEKLRQYDKMTLYAEALMNKFHEYAGKAIVDGAWPLSEQANVFFIMSGYAYMVGSKPPDLDEEENQVLEDFSEEDNNNDN
jgi:CRISPR-associated protein Csh1